MSKVIVSLGRKISDGNFGNIDVQFSVEVDSSPGESTEATFDKVYSLVEKKLIDHVGEMDDAVVAALKNNKQNGK